MSLMQMMTMNCWKKNVDSQVIKQMSTGETPGSGDIPAEVYKAADPALLDKLIILFQPMSEKSTYLRTSRMQQPSTSTNVGTASPAATNTESAFWSLPVCCWTACFTTSFLRVCVVPAKIQEKCMDQLHDLYTAFLTKAWGRPSTQSAEKGSGGSCPRSAALTSSLQ